MKIVFQDRSFVEFLKKENGKVQLSLGSIKKENNRNILSVSSAELTEEEFDKLSESLKKTDSDEKSSSQAEDVT